MPTPSDDTLPLSPPNDIPTPRSMHSSCPPEEERPHHSPREERNDDDEDAQPESAEPENVEERMTTQQATPEPDVESVPSDTPTLPDSHEKSAQNEEDASVMDTPSPISSPEGSRESDARLAQSMSAAAITSSPSPEHLGHPANDHRLLPNSTSSFLRPGSKFHGTQQSDRQVYDVQVEIKDVDMAESFLCGYLRIQGLTDDHPTLTTFFEGEIVGDKHIFKTTHTEWGSSEKVDLQHWARFPAWRPLAKQAKSPNFSLKNYQQREHIFMRWKEYFLVPDHKVKTITGASFEGFYYICFNQCTGGLSGIYFHAKSEKYQQLELKHVDDRGCMGAMEFR